MNQLSTGSDGATCAVPPVDLWPLSCIQKCTHARCIGNSWHCLVARTARGPQRSVAGVNPRIWKLLVQGGTQPRAEGMRQDRPPPPVLPLVAERPKLSTWPGDIHSALVHAMHHHIPLGEAVSQFMRVYYPFIDWEAGDSDRLVVMLMDALFMNPLQLPGYPQE